jgi:hypothetical protein
MNKRRSNKRTPRRGDLVTTSWGWMGHYYTVLGLSENTHGGDPFVKVFDHTRNAVLWVEISSLELVETTTTRKSEDVGSDDP